MYERLTALYAAGRLTPAQIDGALARGWITAEQRDSILGSEVSL